MIKKKFIIVGVLTILSLCSCQSSTVTDKEGSTTPVFSTYHFQDEITDYLTADIDVQVPQSDFLCPVYQTEMFQMSYEEFEQVKEQVLKDDTITYENTTEEKQDEYMYTNYSTSTSANESIVYSRGVYGVSFFYASEEVDNLSFIEQIFTDNTITQWWSEEDLERVEEELDFASRQETVEVLTEFLSQLRISVTEETEVYALDRQALESLAEKHNESMVYEVNDEHKIKKEWAKEDECYVVVFREELNSLPVLSEFNNSNAMNEIEETEINFIYQNGEIIAFSICNPYCDSEQYDQVALLPFEDIIKALHKKYDSIIWEDDAAEQEIKSIELVYYAGYMDDTKEKICLRPVWVFEISNPVPIKGVSGSYSTHIMFDAETGKEVIGNQ